MGSVKDWALPMITSNDEILNQAARDNNLLTVKDLLSKWTGTEYKDGLLCSYPCYIYYISYIDNKFYITEWKNGQLAFKIL